MIKLKKILIFFREHPGYSLNSIALFASIIIIFTNQYSLNKELLTKDAILHKIVMGNFSTCIVKKNIDQKNNQQINDISYDNIRKGIMAQLFNDMSSYQLYNIQPEDLDKRKFEYYEEVTDNLNIRKTISEITPQNIQKKTDEICMKINSVIKEQTPMIKNRKIIILWIIFTSLYIILIGFSYGGWNLEIEKGEPILNIIDVGLYLSLIEYSGGFNSPLKWVLVTSIVIAVLDARRLYELIILRYNSISSISKWKDFSTIFSTLSPSILYLFALSSGLVWSTIGLDNNQNNLHIFFIKYFTYLGLILIYGVTINIVLDYFSKFQNQSSKII